MASYIYPADADAARLLCLPGAARPTPSPQGRREPSASSSAAGTPAAGMRPWTHAPSGDPGALTRCKCPVMPTVHVAAMAASKGETSCCCGCSCSSSGCPSTDISFWSSSEQFIKVMGRAVSCGSADPLLAVGSLSSCIVERRICTSPKQHPRIEVQKYVPAFSLRSTGMVAPSTAAMPAYHSGLTMLPNQAGRTQCNTGAA